MQGRCAKDPPVLPSSLVQLTPVAVPRWSCQILLNGSGLLNFAVMNEVVHYQADVWVHGLHIVDDFDVAARVAQPIHVPAIAWGPRTPPYARLWVTQTTIQFNNIEVQSGSVFIAGAACWPQPVQQPSGYSLRVACCEQRHTSDPVHGVRADSAVTDLVQDFPGRNDFQKAFGWEVTGVFVYARFGACPNAFVTIERTTFQNLGVGVWANECAEIVVRNCTFGWMSPRAQPVEREDVAISDDGMVYTDARGKVKTTAPPASILPLSDAPNDSFPRADDPKFVELRAVRSMRSVRGC